MKKQDLIINDIIAYFEDNTEEFEEVIEALDSYNGYLGDNRYFNMEDLSDFYCNCDVIEILNRAYFGRDDDSYMTNSRGEKEYNSFNPNRNYFYYNGYGNLVSSDYKDYSCYLDNWFVKAIIENKNELFYMLPETVTQLIDEYEKAEEEEQEK